jgi:hypothetical protein
MAKLNYREAMQALSSHFFVPISDYVMALNATGN